MSLKMILFDLDGTLLPMDQEQFARQYFSLLAKKLAPHGYAPEKLVEAIWAGTAAMVKNDGHQSNEATFWDDFAMRFEEKSRNDLPIFDEFYATDFAHVQDVCGFDPQAAETVFWIRQQGFRVALATNPIFPAVATESRIRWAGLQPEDFEWYTTYENSRFCKPNPRYYQDILDHLQLKPEECLMVGNDATEDLAAQQLGIPVFLLTNCLINKKNIDLTTLPHGDFSQLKAYLCALASS